MAHDISILRRCQLFAGLPDEHLETILSRAQQRAYDKDSTVFEEGDPGNTLYVVDHGAVAIRTTSPTGKPTTLAILGEGDAFGELALLDGARRSATVTAEAPTTMIVIYRDDFQDLMASQPEFRDAILESLARVIRHLNTQLGEEDLGIPRRVARVFIDLAREHGVDIATQQPYYPGVPGSEGILISTDVPVSEIASRARLYEGAVEHLLIDWQYMNVISKLGDSYVIMRIREMEEMAGEELDRSIKSAAE
ncbi:MAG: Crp/Fnr family transcriptional regulator, partial [Anaerolineae bacterium]